MSEARPPSAYFPLNPPLPLPPGRTEAELLALLSSLELEGAPKQEIANYCGQDWKRFVYTYGLVANVSGACLELGANPYFTTVLLKHFTRLELTLANYFGPHFGAISSQNLTVVHPDSGDRQEHTMEFFHFNIEEAAFPFASESFSVVLLCEIIKHLQHDPVKVLLEIKRILKPSGRLVLSTPNVNRLENVCRMLAGANIYDPYSGYDAYGRHNREYNKHELYQLLDYCGFDLETLFSADVHENGAGNYYPVERVVEQLRPRENDLGQYLFLSAVNERPARAKRPAWLYRSYPPGEIEA